MLRRKLVIGLTVLAAAAFAGGAYAAAQDSPSKERQAYLSDVAKRLHVTPAQLNNALAGAFHDQLQAAVKAGRLTQAQANAIEQRAKQHGGVPFPLGPRGFHFFGGHRAGAGGLLGAAAKYLGLTRDQLLSQLSSGKSLAQVAKAKGKDAAGVQQAIVSDIQTRLDKAVAAGRLTRGEERQLLARLNARVSAVINRSFHLHHRGFEPRGGPRPGPWFGPPPSHPGSYVPAPGAGTID
jgi:hypothetical protein